MDTIELMKKRKSTRAFSNEGISKEEKRIIINAALQAPTAGNMALYSIIDIQQQQIKDQLSELCDHQPFIARADMVLVYAVDFTKWMEIFEVFHCNHYSLGESDLILALEDTAIAAQNSVIAAESLGIGSCYIGDIMENYEKVSSLLNLPQYAMPLVMVVYGRPAKSAIDRKKPKRFAYEDMVFTDRYANIEDINYINIFEKQTEKSGEDLEDYIHRFYQRKMNSPFNQEMIRSVKVMLQRWTKIKEGE